MTAQFRQADPGGKDHEIVALMCDAMRSATVPGPAADPIHHSALLMTAAAAFAGSIAGTLIVAGLLDDSRSEKHRLAKNFETNFLEGIKVGIARATRLAQAEGVSQ